MIESVRKKSGDFRFVVDIKGLPYIFSGGLPTRAGEFYWELTVPEMEGYPFSEAKGDFFDTEAQRDAYLWNRAAAGFVRVGAYRTKPGLNLIDIRSNTNLLTTRSLYHNAGGIGTFLLRNVTSLADLLEEEIYLKAIPGEGRLNGEQRLAWYERHGFQRQPIPEGQTWIPMIRPPHAR